jgi:hypothetical protein
MGGRLNGSDTAMSMEEEETKDRAKEQVEKEARRRA